MDEFPKESIAMRKMSSPLICRRMAKAFNAGQVEYVGRGFNNAHHRLSSIPNSPDLIIRRMLFPVNALDQRIKREYKVLEYLYALGYQNAPHPVRLLNSGEIDECPGFAMTYISGINPSFTPNSLFDLGKAVRLLHELPVPNWLVESGYSTNPDVILHNMCAVWPRKLDSIKDLMIRKDFEKLQKTVGIIPQIINSIYWTGYTSTLLHGDLGDHNIRYDELAEKLILLDWEFASVSDSLLDLMWLFNRRGFGKNERKFFFNGYGNISKEKEEKLDLLVRLCLVEDVIWAQSGLNDIKMGINAHYFREGDEEYLMKEVQRIHDI